MNEKINEREAGVELRVQDLLMAYLRQWKLIIICILIASVIAWGVTFFCMTPLYKASTTIYVNNSSGVTDPEGITSGDVSASIYLVKSYVVLARSDTVLEKVAEKMGGEYTVAELYSAITPAQIDNAIIFNLHVSHKDPVVAQEIANHLADVLVDVGPNIISGSRVSVIDTARVPTAPYSPDYTGNVATGAAAGLLLAIAYATIQFLKDTRIKDENDPTDMFNLPILGRIPDFNDSVTGTRYAETESEGEEEV